MNTFENSLPAASLPAVSFPASPTFSESSTMSCESDSESHSSDGPSHSQKSIVSNGGVVLAENMEEYIKSTYQEKGHEGAYDVLFTFLGAMEKREVIEYKIEGVEVDKSEYTRHLLNETLGISGEVTEEIQKPYENENQFEMDEKTWNELLSQLTWTTEEEIDQYEVLLKQNYQRYKELVEEEARIQLERNTLSYQFAQNVTAWAHLRIVKPITSDRRSISQYVTEKHRLLRMMLPDLSLHRMLTLKLKFVDDWGKFSYPIETDLSAVWGSVAQPPSFSSEQNQWS
ncbi:hypothetical protein G6F56_011899 [Rhizopus delemar]|nr:hypothetical protein G6F56_011899 [Rhizopus delemar]